MPDRARIPSKVSGGTTMPSPTLPVRLKCIFPPDISARDTESPYKYLNNKFLHVEPEMVMPLNPDPKMPRVTAKYQLVAKIGFGGFSTVWIARRLNKPKNLDKFDYWCAIKIMAANTGDAAKELNSINRVRECGVDIAGFRSVTDTWKEVKEGNRYLCIPMELSGPTVMDCILAEPKAGTRLAIAYNAVDVMDKLHANLKEEEIISDFTSSNLLVKIGERVKKYTKDEMYKWIIQPPLKYAEVKQEFVNKYGKLYWDTPLDPVPNRLYAKISLVYAASNDSSLNIIDVHQDAGTFAIDPNYASPEALSTQKTSIPSNVWSLGVILCEALTGEYPFNVGGNDSLGKSEQKQKARLAECARITLDFDGNYVWNEDQHDCISELLFQIFNSRGKIPLADIRKLLDKIESGKQSAKPSAAEIKGGGKRSNSLQLEDLRTVKASSTAPVAPSSSSRRSSTTSKPRTPTGARSSSRTPKELREVKDPSDPSSSSQNPSTKSKRSSSKLRK